MKSENKPLFQAIFRLSEGEFSRAYRWHLRRTLFSVKNIGLVMVALVLMVGQSQVLGAMPFTKLLFLVIWGVLAGLVVYAFVSVPGQLYRRTSSLQGEQELRVFSEEISIGAKGAGQILDGSAFSRILENNEFFLFYSQASLTLVIPKRIFVGTDDALEQFRHAVWGK